ncbi:MAG TPA: DUF1501 domain-containing protein [Pirellulaceae bacterium]|nr:DUF1501 domain-containing protein [Pirellulaceae bacterium]
MSRQKFNPGSNGRPVASESTRRAFLAGAGMGVAGLALGSLLNGDGVVRGAESTWIPPDGKPHFRPKAKSVIWIFLVGGMSQMESFDPKPELNKYSGKTFAQTPYKDVLDSPYVKKNLREVIEGLHKVHPTIFPMQVGYKKYGQAGLEISDWWRHVGEWCADDVALVRGMWTTDNNHGAQLQFHTGRHSLEGPFPTIGSWVHYGLGTLNENLPQFVVMGTPIADCCGGVGAHGANYLGPAHDGVQLAIDPRNPLPFNTPGGDVYREEQSGEFQLLGRLNQIAAEANPDDAALAARMKSYELAYRMQTAVPEIVDFNAETAAIRQMYGLEQSHTKTFGQQCLAARRLVEQGVRFIQIFHGSNGGAGAWDAHGGLKNGHTSLCGQVDQPIAALIKDLKQRGLLDETIVCVGTEFGRTPGAQNSDGRDHHPYGFSVLLAGGGVRGGIVHGATDELGFHAIEGRHYVTDIHATVLHQLGLDPARLQLPGRVRLEIDLGRPIKEVLV